jgi:hypothetical protein
VELIPMVKYQLISKNEVLISFVLIELLLIHYHNSFFFVLGLDAILYIDDDDSQYKFYHVSVSFFSMSHMMHNRTTKNTKVPEKARVRRSNTHHHNIHTLHTHDKKCNRSVRSLSFYSLSS